MAIEEAATDAILEIGSIIRWIQAIGGIILVWIILQVSNWWINQKRLKKLDEFEKSIARIERKLNELLKKN